MLGYGRRRGERNRGNPHRRVDKGVLAHETLRTGDAIVAPSTRSISCRG
jgi:hypothetical protein